jgi:integrase
MDNCRSSVAASTFARDKSIIGSLILPTFGPRGIGEITPEQIERWVRGLEDDGKSAATVAKATQILASVLDRAVARRRLLTNPAKVGGGINLPKPDAETMRTLSPAEVEAIADAVDDRYRVMVLMGAFMGMRWSEIAGLTANREDLEKRTIRVDRQLLRATMDLGPVKTKAGRRTLAVPGSLASELAAHLDQWPAVGDGLVFTSPGGGPIRYSNWRRRVWVPAVAATVGEPCTFHSLRHTHARWLIEGGEHPKTIQSRLGHGSIRVTLDRYASFFDNLDREAADRLDAHLAGEQSHLRDTKASGEVFDFPS